ncbi:HTH-type transcriptional regulator Xre [Sporomusa ovata DSM 2662]|uniref:Negative regulation of the defective prophage PBSX genes n=1 Tax=Sporomusa ovata TaxID=2378 RepID=A0A0U1L473_9FIRM|nr:helix-turn-helix domain-containing protein [Sporomusa ovata]EQB25557.1 transcriptional regulator XRE family [Sporomusa ovata DSM 2662]CQR74119.1 negative regulation of the defective prophage PBSX genes [Sporomusa ovata]
MSTFSQRLKELRIDRALTQSEFGALFNLSKQTISGYEKGDAAPPIETLQKFADFFGTTTDDLLGRKPIKIIPNEDGIITKEDMRKAGITSEEIDIIKVTRKEGLTAEDIQHLAEVVKRHKSNSADHVDKKQHDPKIFLP